jgi:hypothetical protein
MHHFNLHDENFNRKSNTIKIPTKWLIHECIAWHRNKWHTWVSFRRGVRAVTRDFALGLSRASNCKQREAKRTSSVPSSFEKWPSKQESISIRKFFPRIRSSACQRSKWREKAVFRSKFYLNCRNDRAPYNPNFKY